MTTITSRARSASPEEASSCAPYPAGRPRGPDGPRRQGATLAPWGVVGIWAGLLGILVATDAGFGNNMLVLEISGSSAGFVLLLAGAVWLDRRLRPGRGYLRQPTRVGGIIMLALTALLAWMGFAFGAWLMMIAVLPLIAAIGLEILARRNTRSLDSDMATAVPAPPAGQPRRPQAPMPVRPWTGPQIPARHAAAARPARHTGRDRPRAGSASR
jgi:hypothetical protein